MVTRADFRNRPHVSAPGGDRWLIFLQIRAAMSLPALIGFASPTMWRANPLSIPNSPNQIRACEVVMFRDKETRFLEAGLLAAVPICVAITALLALLTLAKI